MACGLDNGPVLRPWSLYQVFVVWYDRYSMIQLQCVVSDLRKPRCFGGDRNVVQLTLQEACAPPIRRRLTLGATTKDCLDGLIFSGQTHAALPQGRVLTHHGIADLANSIPLGGSFGRHCCHIALSHDLVSLAPEPSCSSTGRCGFSLTDDGTTETATALPHLSAAVFGCICPADSCRVPFLPSPSFPLTAEI